MKYCLLGFENVPKCPYAGKGGMMVADGQESFYFYNVLSVWKTLILSYSF